MKCGFQCKMVTESRPSLYQSDPGFSQFRVRLEAILTDAFREDGSEFCHNSGSEDVVLDGLNAEQAAAFQPGRQYWMTFEPQVSDEDWAKHQAAARADRRAIQEWRDSKTDAGQNAGRPKGKTDAA